MMWFYHNNPNAVYVDCREVSDKLIWASKDDKIKTTPQTAAEQGKLICSGGIMHRGDDIPEYIINDMRRWCKPAHYIWIKTDWDKGKGTVFAPSLYAEENIKNAGCGPCIPVGDHYEFLPQITEDKLERSEKMLNIYTKTDGTTPKSYSYSINPFIYKIARPDTKEIIITHSFIPPIEKVIFNEPATIVLWADGDKTVVKCQDGDTYSKETGLAMCIAKKALGNKGNFNDVFKEWIPGYGEKVKINCCDNCKHGVRRMFYNRDIAKWEDGIFCILYIDTATVHSVNYTCDKWEERDGESD